MKLGPEDLLHLYEHTSTKSERADFLCAQGVCFGDVPATMNYALSSITVERERLGYGLDGSKLRSMISAIQYPSLRSSTGMSMGSRLAEEEKDLPDEELVFGIVELPGRGQLEVLERFIERDGVQTGEWVAFVAADVEIEQ